MDNNKTLYKPVVLIIVDGWGISPSWGGNALAINSPTFMNGLWRQYPHAVLQATELNEDGRRKVGLSETGHASLGSGRLVTDDFSDINYLIKSERFFKTPALVEACSQVKKNNSTLHVIGMLSTGVFHGNLNHITAMIELAKREGVKRLALHLITDGINDRPTAATEHISRLQDVINEKGVGTIVTLAGRYYAMDESGNIDRTLQAYKAQVLAKAYFAETAFKALAVAYAKGYNDEIIPPVIIAPNGRLPHVDGVGLLPMKKEDAVIFTNFKESGIKQLAQALGDEGAFRRYRWQRIPFINPHAVTFTDYRLPPDVKIAFPLETIKSTLSELLSRQGFRQLKITESVKADLITYFFNGGRKEPFEREDRIIVPSPNKDSFIKKPELAINNLTKRIIQTIRSRRYDFIVTNLSNVDILAHTGDIMATNRAVLKLDGAVNMIVKAVMETGGAAILTSDHGHAEQMVYQESERRMQHTNNPVPFILVTKDNHQDLFHSAMSTPASVITETLRSRETIADVAPTILNLFSTPVPSEMTGQSLLKILNGGSNGNTSGYRSVSQTYSSK